MRLIASVAVGLLILSACSDADAEADADTGGEPSTPGSDPSGGPTEGGDIEQTLLPAVAVSTAIEDARSAPTGQWTFTTTVDFLDNQLRQSVAATRQYDRRADRSLLRVDIDIADETERLSGAFGGRSTEVARVGDDVFVRSRRPDVENDEWYDLGGVALEELLAWNYLFVDPLGERMPLLGFLDGDAVEIGVGTSSSGEWRYPVSLDGAAVISRLRDEAPAITGWLPPDLDVDAIDTVALGEVHLDEQGRLVGVRIDLGPTVQAIADTVDDDYDKDFYSSAQVQLDVIFDPDAAVDVPAPAPSAAVPAAVPIEEVPAAELGLGDCLPPATDLRQSMLPLVDCEQAHTFEVSAVVEAWDESEPYPGRAEVRARADEECIAAFEEYVGMPFERSVHSVAAISPLAEGWDEGDRTVVCLAEAYLPRRESLSGAAE